jgi:hypothetical protein
MNCARAEQLFSDCWDDELSVAERDAVHAHFAACAVCRAEYDAFARTMQAVHSLPRLAAAGDFTDQVLARARAAEAERRPGRSASRTLPWTIEWRWQPAFAAAAALAVVAGGVWVGVLSRSPMQSPVSPSQVATRTQTRPPAASPIVAEASPSPASLQARAERPVEVATAGDAASTGSASAPDELRAAPRTERTLGANETAALPDTAFDHSYDVEFAFEPVNLRRVAGESKVAPARPSPTSEVGRPAKFTF